MKTVLNCYNQGAAKISIKNDMVLKYIESLPEGSRISVRELSAKLLVSEGTAYKAVKEAEQLGMVMVKPKAGTVRISMQQPSYEKSVSAADTAKMLGLSVSAGKANLNRRIRRLIICDGSRQDLLRQMEGLEPSACLCLCGDRPELQTEILERGANLLLTGGIRPSWVLANLAERRGLLVFTSPQSAYALVRLFDSELDEPGLQPGGDKVSAWMQAPDYMYYNDIVADWHRHYAEGSLAQQYPVVDDDLELIGALDMWKAATANPSQKLSSVLADSEDLETVSTEDSVRDVTRRFVVSGQFVAPVLEGKRMMGMISAIDLLRYYMCSEPEPGSCTTDSFLSRDVTVSQDYSAVFRVQVPPSALGGMGHLENDLLLSAAESHLRQLGLANYRLTNGTFMAFRPLEAAEGLRLESRMQANNSGSAVLEVELYDEKLSYAKMVITATAQEKKGE